MQPGEALAGMKVRPKRILFLSSSWPRGRSFGGQLRALHTGRALTHVGEVTMVVVGSETADADTVRDSGTEFRIEAPVVAQPTRSAGLGAKLRRAFDTRYLDLHGCAASHSDQERISRLARDHDFVWLLNSRTPQILQRWSWPNAHLDVDDVPSTYLRTVANRESNPFRRFKVRFRQRLLHRRELLYHQRFTTLSVCSTEDKAYLGGSERIHVIPNGFERPATTPSPCPVWPPRIGFIGLFSYAPNLEGVRWFLRECWPELRRTIPGIRFRLIGTDTDGPLKPNDPGVDALGWMPDPATEIASWSTMVIPIHEGGGTRIKLADAFSRKCPVVSTRLGAFGYDVTDRVQLRIADTAAEFRRACHELVQHPDLGKELAARAWIDFLDQWTWDAIASRVWAAAEDCLRRNGTPASRTSSNAG
jgi:glycosyltransferase involved in cell wall biosynthesis